MGFFPENWTEGVIVPLHKKGDACDVNNYRGITLVSCMSKIFTSVLNHRITEFCNSHNVISDCQFGFRRGMSTLDAIFVLMSIVQKYMNENKRLYCVFVDLKKAFDSIYRNALWLKLYRQGIQGKMLRVIKDMYEKAKSCVKHCNSYSDFFKCSLGLRQGEVISPIMFSLFIEDLELFLQRDVHSGLLLDDITLILLLFADDMVIIAKSPGELQDSLNLLSTYCGNWGLGVNVNKTKVMVFRKRGKLKDNENWVYNNQNLETVDNFNYLGTVFNYTGNFSLNQEHVTGKALRALNVLLVNCRHLNLKPKVLCQLFDSFVFPILSYASEIWGYSKSKEIERVHLKFCKQILRVRKNTCNASVYGELGRYPLFIHRYLRTFNYWCKLINTDNIILKTVYKQMLQNCVDNGHKNWLLNVKCLLQENGFGYVWECPEFYNLKSVYIELKQRLIDCFVQKWNGDKRNRSVLVLYNSFKHEYKYETYMDVLPTTLRCYMSRIRMSSHSLRINTGRYTINRIDRNERYCQYCNTHDIEDEFHFIIKCPQYTNLRRKYISSYYFIRPSVFKFVNLMKSTNTKELINLARFIKESLDVRISETY